VRHQNLDYIIKELIAKELIVNSLAKETTKSKANKDNKDNKNNKDNNKEFNLDKEIKDNKNVYKNHQISL
jgi:hypothetical protein